MEIFTKIEKNPINTSEEYYFLMNIVSSLISDDHSSVNLDIFTNNEDVRYLGFIFSFVDGSFKVIHSIVDAVPLDSEIL